MNEDTVPGGGDGFMTTYIRICNIVIWGDEVDHDTIRPLILFISVR